MSPLVACDYAYWLLCAPVGVYSSGSSNLQSYQHLGTLEAMWYGILKYYLLWCEWNGSPEREDAPAPDVLDFQLSLPRILHTKVNYTYRHRHKHRSFFWAGLVGTSLASQKFPPEHRLRLLLAGPFQLFFAFSTFFLLLPFSHFFVFLLPHFCCSVFVHT